MQKACEMSAMGFRSIIALAATSVILVLPSWGQEKAKLKSGLLGEYYKIGEDIDDFPSFAKRKPTFVRIDAEINFELAKAEFGDTKVVDNFYVRWTGLIRIPKNAVYKFYTESDDGSRLFIDGKLVVDNGGLHSLKLRKGEVDLKVGDHEIKIDFFDNRHEAGCKVFWESEDVFKKVIPAEVLFHKECKRPSNK